MALCEQCGCEIKPGYLFCGNCGSSVPAANGAAGANNGAVASQVTENIDWDAAAAIASLHSEPETPYVRSVNAAANAAVGAAGFTSAGVVGSDASFPVGETAAFSPIGTNTYGNDAYGTAPGFDAGFAAGTGFAADSEAVAAPGTAAEPKKKRSKIPYVLCAVVAVVLVSAIAFLAVDPFGLGAPQSASESAAVVDAVQVESDTTPKPLGKAVVPNEDYAGDAQGANADGDADSQDAAGSSGATGSEDAGSVQTEAADDYVLADSSDKYYSKSDLEKLSNRELYFARNEIFARHGRGFNNDDLQSYFNQKDWYTKQYSPEDFDAMPDVLNKYEKKNTETMLAIEKERNSPYLK